MKNASVFRRSQYEPKFFCNTLKYSIKNLSPFLFCSDAISRFKIFDFKFIKSTNVVRATVNVVINTLGGRWVAVLCGSSFYSACRHTDIMTLAKTPEMVYILNRLIRFCEKEGRSVSELSKLTPSRPLLGSSPTKHC